MSEKITMAEVTETVSETSDLLRIIYNSYPQIEGRSSCLDLASHLMRLERGLLGFTLVETKELDELRSFRNQALLEKTTTDLFLRRLFNDFETADIRKETVERIGAGHIGILSGYMIIPIPVPIDKGDHAKPS